MQDLDIVARVVKQLAGPGVRFSEMRRYQCEISIVQSPQQIIQRAIAGPDSHVTSRQHDKLPIPGRTIISFDRTHMFTSGQTVERPCGGFRSGTG
jgi:hypothetical protein